MSKVEDTMSKEDYDLLLKMRAHARDTEDDYLEAAEAAKQAKKRMEGAALRLNKFLDELGDGPLPLEEQAERNRNGDADPSGLFEGGTPVDEPGPETEAQEPGEIGVVGDEDAWRYVDIGEIGNHGIKPAVIKRLREAKIGTIGDLAAYTSADRNLTDVPGIGEETRNAIIDAMIAYFEAHPMPKPQVVDPTTEANGDETPGGVENGPRLPQDEPAEAGTSDHTGEPDDASESGTEAQDDAPPKKPKRKRRRKARDGEGGEGPEPTPDQPE
jgi:hypothetical protein